MPRSSSASASQGFLPLESTLATTFWGWDRPVLQKAVEELTRGWRGGELDLSATIILVPTSETGRRLREALATHVAARDGAVVAPYVWHPESALAWQIDRAGLATSLQEQLAWATVLGDIAVEEFAHLFPVTPGMERRLWATGVAETLAGLKRSLGAGGFSFAEVAKRLGESEDAPRWEELAILETRYLEALQRFGVQDTQQVKAARATKPLLPAEATRLLVFAFADPPLLLRRWLRNAAASIPVQIFVQAPPKLQPCFDEHGVPLIPVWTAGDVRPEIIERQLHLVTQPQDQARTAVELLREVAQTQPALAVGICDTSLAPHLIGALAGEDVHAYDPAGKDARQHPLLEMLRGWQRLALSRTWRSFASLVRQDEVLRVVAPQYDFTESGLLSLLDDFMAKRLPSTLEEALDLSTRTAGLHHPAQEAEAAAKLAKLHALLADFLQRLDAWGTLPVTDALRSLLEWIYGKRQFSTESEADRDHSHLLGEAMRLAVECQETSVKLGEGDTASQLFSVVLKELEAVPLADRRGDVDLVLQGWLELLWEPAAALVIAGFNDESVPGMVKADPFLPDHMRESLGLSCQAARRARDAYLLAALAGQRKADGALHLIVGQINDAGDVLRPSRLLFACDDTTLTQRVRQLFPKDVEAPTVAEPPRGEPVWKLLPNRLDEPLKSVSPSLLGGYLRCPLRCYFERFLGMSAVDAAQRELTPGDFGGLVHEVLYAFGKEPSLKDAFSEEPIRAFFESTLTRIAQARWGKRPLLSTAIQIDTARQRLYHLAKVQAELRRDGWETLEVEFKLNSLDLTLAGVPFTGRVDRIDRHSRDGRIRVWDYKTRHKSNKPDASHIASAKAEDLEDPEQSWKCFTNARDKVQQWTDLQLPLYVWALRKQYPEATSIEAGYIHLPAAVTETKAEVWEGLDETLVDLAHTCAVDATTRMKEGIFWPPNEKLRGDPYEELLLGSAEYSVEQSAFWKGAPLVLVK